ncbi:hypothetical protein HRbin39_00517 [bacterium HR39]|nr:hypothetical protein HRbin39_00517 [bacterium HR39]
MPRRAAAALAALAMAFGATAASAARLVPGGYAADPQVLPGEAADAGEPTFVLEFTPRTAVGLLLESDEHLRLRTGRLGLPDAAVTSLPAPSEPRRGLVLGGALQTGGLLVGGYYARAELFGAPADVLAARVRYGAVEAELGVVSQPEGPTDPYRLFTLGAAFAATPWLAVESDLAVGRRGEDEPLAAGRIGIRLDF